ncbi:MAG: hypothetical protein ACLGHQ_09780 [Acidimicrobiia bacterium]
MNTFTTPVHTSTPDRTNPAGARTTRRASYRLLGVVTLVALAASACGDDDESMSADACDRYAELQAGFFGDPSQLGSAAQAFADAAPSSLEDDLATLVTAFGSDDPDAMGSPEFVAANERIGDAVFSGCDTVAAIDVDGIDYAFSGLPETVGSGRVAVRLHNETETEQPHEMIIVTGTDGQSADELSDLPMDQLMQQARPVGLAFVDAPGASSTTLLDLQPGSYLIICTLPVAEGGEMPDGEGPHDSHADHGMVATLTVV